MVSKAIELKEADGKLVAGVFARAVEKNLCSIPAFEEGFLPTAELLDDIAIYVPKAFQIMAVVMKGVRLDQDVERRTRIAQESMDSDKLLGLLAYAFLSLISYLSFFLSTIVSVLAIPTVYTFAFVVSTVRYFTIACIVRVHSSSSSCSDTLVLISICTMLLRFPSKREQ